MKYAVIRFQGHQYKVAEGDTILVDKITGEVSPEVLLFVDGENVVVGTPIVEGAKLSWKKLEDERGEKLHVFKYKSKSRYRKKTGFRQDLTRIQIEKLSI